MHFISEIKATHWLAHMTRCADRGDHVKADAASRELHCWQYMAGVEKHVAAIIEQTRKTANVPGELRYHIEALAKWVDTSNTVAARISGRLQRPSTLNPQPR